ncbi:MAG: DNA polymerase domain-containing protein [Kiritimatiellia bacterium]
MKFNRNDPLLTGSSTDQGLVALEKRERRGKPDEAVLFFRRGGDTRRETEPFKCFIAAGLDAMADCPVEYEAVKLKGRGPINILALFGRWKDCLRARSWLARNTGFTAGSPYAPYLFINDPVAQHLMLSGRTLFGGMDFESLKRMQIDIECVTAEGFEFCNAEREGDRIVAIAVGDGNGEVQVLSGTEMSEKELLEKLAELVREKDPDVIEGHNIFNFDLPYIAERARRHGVKPALGRDGSPPRARPSRLNIAERTISYQRFDIFGRHIVDTLFLVHAYDVATRSLDGFGLKEVARHFGIAPADREYIDGSRITETFNKDPEKVMKYVRHDVMETERLARLLSASAFAQAGILPCSYQNVCVRGNATKIDTLMVREYLRRQYSLPLPDEPREFAGGYTDLFREGVVHDVHHCDVRSLYPSLMLTRKMAPRSDELGVFLQMLAVLRDLRMEARQKATNDPDRARRDYYDSFQAAFKILINSFYGYLGFPRGRFSDFETAEKVAGEGRELLKKMISRMKELGAEPVEIDTDGIYFVPPPECRREKPGQKPDARQKALEQFRQDFIRILPEGIELEFDGEYRSMYSYKMKNYALLDHDGEMVIKGGALKSRGLEPFQRSFLREIIRLKLEGRENELPQLKARWEKSIVRGEWPIEELAKTETLQDSPGAYSARRAKGKTPRRAAYELALASNREYRAGDQVSYYVTGSKKSVSVHQNSKLVSEWNPGERDENIPYYLGKLEALYKKFAGTDDGWRRTDDGRQRTGDGLRTTDY